MHYTATSLTECRLVYGTLLRYVHHDEQLAPMLHIIIIIYKVQSPHTYTYLHLHWRNSNITSTTIQYGVIKTNFANGLVLVSAIENLYFACYSYGCKIISKS